MGEQRIRNVPSVIFLDAVGTLFGVKGSVGAIYSEIARQHGVEVAPAVVDRAFLQAFRAAGTPAFPGRDPSELQAKEFTWWLKVASQTFKQAGVFHQFSDFSIFFSDLYNCFATAHPWFVYPDVPPALKRWQQMGIQLGILSNFDSRIYAVLDALKLSAYFSSVTISTEVGAAKPDPHIFTIALQKHHCLPQLAWHIGDRYEEDYQPARAIGMRGIWLRRKE